MDGRARILDQIAAVIDIDVMWFAIGDDQQKPAIAQLPFQVLPACRITAPSRVEWWLCKPASRPSAAIS